MHKKLPRLFIFLDRFNKNLFDNNITNLGIVYRNYNSANRLAELTKISKFCKKNRYQLFVSNDVKLATKVNAEGIYIPSFNRKLSVFNLEKKGLRIIGSAHNQKEIYQKIKQNCSLIFLSPVFLTTKNKKFLEVHKFNLLTRSNKIKFFALGGIRNNNISRLQLLNIKGFGGIEFFKKKPACKRPVFKRMT